MLFGFASANGCVAEGALGWRACVDLAIDIGMVDACCGFTLRWSAEAG